MYMITIIYDGTFPEISIFRLPETYIIPAFAVVTRNSRRFPFHHGVSYTAEYR